MSAISLLLISICILLTLLPSGCYALPDKILSFPENQALAAIFRALSCLFGIIQQHGDLVLDVIDIACGSVGFSRLSLLTARYW